MNRWSMSRHTLPCLFSLFAAVTVTGAPASAQQQQKPNIVVIMGDDIGMWNIGAYHRGLMAGRTPNLDKIAKEGMLFKATRASLLAGAIASHLMLVPDANSRYAITMIARPIQTAHQSSVLKGPLLDRSGRCSASYAGVVVGVSLIVAPKLL